MFHHRFIVLACVTVASALIATGCQQTQSSNRTDKADLAAEQGRVEMVIEFGDLRENIRHEADWIDNQTVLALLADAARKNGTTVDYDGKGSTAFVKGIAGIAGGKEGRDWWIYTVNDKLAHQGSDVLILSPGDRVVWKLGEYK